MRDRGTQVRNINWVLDWLLVEGVFDQEEPYMRSTAEKMSMVHSIAMDQRLLMRIESLKHWVCLSSS